MHRHAMRRGNLAGQSGGRHIPLLRDPAGDPVLQGEQLAVAPPLPWTFGTRPPVAFINLTMSLMNLTENFEQHCRRAVRVPLRNMVNHPLP